jgi:5-methylcytosine-specific restriction protein B
LRPVTGEDGELTYRVEEGVLKSFSRRAFNVLLDRAEIAKEWTDTSGIPALTSEEKAKVRQVAPGVPFYLVIDEINRGDIARIFGELITLLEADKRYGEENELVTTLPYSKQKFAVPPNLYLIGTMNTADRSISLVDVALRRRFGFIELMPDYVALENIIRKPAIQDIAGLAVSLLMHLNEKIVASYDRDHQVGHSYFTRLQEAATREEAVERLHFAWYHEIVPLLQEYYYDAPRKLHGILGDDFVEVYHDGRAFSFREPLDGEEFVEAIRKIVGTSAAPRTLMPAE